MENLKQRPFLYITAILSFFMIGYMFVTVISFQVQLHRLGNSISETLDTPEPEVSLDIQTPDAPRKDCVPQVGQEDQPC